MKLKIKCVFLVPVILMLAGNLILTGYHSAPPSTIPRYLKSVTYFGDEWAVNFWNSESKDMEAEMAQIASDGFNSIILVIPWREFQPEMEPLSYNSFALDKLDRVMEAAGRHGLWVVLRIGYTWDYYPGGESGMSRCEDMMKKKSVRDAWLDYAATLYHTAAAHQNFYGGFITWEDFWNYTHKAAGLPSRYARLQEASMCGYMDYARQNYSLDELSQLYEEKIKRYDDVYLPEAKQPAMMVFYEFYDNFLNQLLRDTQEVFPGLSMEVRLDGELLYQADGSSYYYNHYATYGCESADYTAAMYGVPIGQVNNYEVLDAWTAISGAVGQLDTVLAHNGGKRLYLDQYLYMDNTPAFAHNAQVRPEQLPAYVMGMIPVLKSRVMGYGIWVYKNYGNNMVYNSQFALGAQGWTWEGDSQVVERDGTPMAMILEGGRIFQRLGGRLSRGGFDTIYMRCTADPEEACNLNVFLGDEVRSVQLDGKTEVLLEFPMGALVDLAIQSSGTVYVDDIKVYTFVQDGQIYGMDGEGLSCLDAIRAMNSQMN